MNLQIKEGAEALTNAAVEALSVQTNRDPLTVVLLIMVILMIFAGGWAYHSLQKKKDQQTDKMIANSSDLMIGISKSFEKMTQCMSSLVTQMGEVRKVTDRIDSKIK